MNYCCFSNCKSTNKHVLKINIIIIYICIILLCHSIMYEISGESESVSSTRPLFSNLLSSTFTEPMGSVASVLCSDRSVKQYALLLLYPVFFKVWRTTCRIDALLYTFEWLFKLLLPFINSKHQQDPITQRAAVDYRYSLFGPSFCNLLRWWCGKI